MWITGTPGGRLKALLIGLTLVASVALPSARVLTRNAVNARSVNAHAQDAIPGPRPVRIYQGTCDAPGTMVVALNSLAAPNGELVGSADRDRTESSVTTNVPLSLDMLIAGPYAISVHMNAETLDHSMACGNIGGVLEGNNSLVIGLREQAQSGVTGIVYLAPNSANASLSIASVFATGSGLGTAIGTLRVVTPVAEAPDVDPPIAENPTAVIDPTEQVQPTEVDEPTEIVEPTEDDDGGGDDDDDGSDHSGEDRSGSD